MNDGDDINILDIDHVYSILSFLRSRSGEEIIATELRQVMSNYGRMMVIIHQLENSGLVKIELETRPRKRYLISLTRKGASVADRLMELDRTIKSMK
ncbi:hypothetical protein [Methanomassiliicoccus luminyensis]|uniref:hypothetical protein n=1 Tax=Methanomassiliicoccus luminyensis TaxID=1080712 RepID=UPI00036F2397|nr:hypothetical protein [Methanomassiliicoccus luminyensis]